MIAKSELKEREGYPLSFFSVFFGLVFFCLLQFNTLPKDQIFPALVLAVFIISLAVAPETWLAFFKKYPKLVCVLAVGPLFLLLSSLSYSYWPWLSIWMSAGFIFLPLTVLMVLAYRKIHLLDLISGFVAVIVINSLSMIFLAYQDVRRPAGLLDDPNLAADFCALGILSTLFLIQQFPRKILYLIQFVLGLALFLSLSRGAALALAGAVCIYLSLCHCKKIQWLGAFVASGFILVLSFFVGSLLLPDGAGVSGLSLSDRPDSMSDRFDMWHSAWLMFLEHPIWGTGLGTFALRYPEFRAFSETSSAGYFAHNDYLQLLAELGIVGFLGWFITPVVLFILCVRAYVRSEDPSVAATSCLVVALVSLVGAHSLVNFVMYHPLINAFLGCVMASSILTQLQSFSGFSDKRRVAVFGVRTFLFIVFLVVFMSFNADVLSRKTINDLQAQAGSDFNVQSEHYYDLLALKYFSPLNVEIRNQIVGAEVNTALKLADTPFGKDLTQQIVDRIDQNSWLQRDNCSQQTDRARLTWSYDKPAAIDILQEILGSVPNCIRGRITLSEAFMSTGQYAEAIKILNEGIDRFVFRENKGQGPTLLIESLIGAYRLSGESENARALEIYLDEFKSQQGSVTSPVWSRRLQF
ncbi:O-antigen ligase family protein [Marinobacter sediminum]|uniref:O-antigen ligase family protein n=1 Tax=Marinobacter sediminum TaxID=256323 RepID=UPI00202DDD2C|nr:O-antigen ligase family protein [Marinobacter sediminum]MCM0612653.1 O-antigen ligase family protein [Marinobacter sediminum]